MLSTTATTRQLARAASSLSTPSGLASRSITPATTSKVLVAAAARRGYATPLGPPPKGFRQQPLKKWDEDQEGTFNKLGKYFLLTEMARGMYVLLEQFFRPP